MSKIELYCDGASRGNPGPAAVGVHFLDHSSNPPDEKTVSRALGVKTNNEAEYTALLDGLRLALDHTNGNPAEVKLEIFMDSELVVKQIKGEYRVKNEKLKPLFIEAKSLLDQIPAWSIRHIPREKNKEADRQANMALDLGK